MIRRLYKTLLRAPKFRGRGRLESALRRMLAPPADDVGGFRMELDPQEWLQIHLLSGDQLERETLNLYRKLLRPGDTYIDVGAHVGFHVLAASACVGREGRLIAIDPQPYNCDKILTNSEINGLGNIVVVAAAAGPEDSFVLLPNQKRNDKARLTLAGGVRPSSASLFDVPVCRLDTIAARHGVKNVRLLKIDVEGYESEVLAGAADLLKRTDHILFESLPEADPSITQCIAATLAAEGFVLRKVNGDPWRIGSPLIENNVWATKD
jgi:FkbM family methyltransferase